MAEQKIWIGSVGPFIYNDTDLVDDDDGDFVGETLGGITSTGQLRIATAPIDDNHVLRRMDVDEAAFLPIEDVNFTMTASGFTTSPISVSCRYIKFGKRITIFITGFSGTSNANTLSMTTLPVEVRPSMTQLIPACVLDNGNGKVGDLTVRTSGVIDAQSIPGNSSSFTPTGQKGVYAISIDYLAA